MHSFSDLAYRCSLFTTDSLNDVEEKTVEALQTSGATSLVKTLQMARLDRIIFAVGMFSVFEALLQDKLNCKDGFREAKRILEQSGDTLLLSKFEDLELAINALKHGQGRSYNTLIAKNGGSLSSKIKLPNEYFFDEGDMSEVFTLIDVNDNFIFSCVDIISQVSDIIKRLKPEVIL
jgi:hypothetical protein